jgi:hypothetical protein
MTLDELKAYFKNVATSLVDIKHSAEKESFFAVHADDEVDGLLKHCKAPFVMVLLSPEKKLTPPKGEDYNWEKMVFLFILGRVSRDNREEKWAVQGRCELLANEVFAGLHEDRFTDFVGFDEKSWLMQPVGPVGDGWYGQACTFEIEDNFVPARNPELWS